MTLSPATFTAFRARLQTTLGDLTHHAWDDATLDEALRRALGDLSAVYGGTALTLSGLDSAAATTFQLEDENTLLCGAQAYAVLFRTLRRLESANLREQVPDQLFDLVQSSARSFNLALRQTHQRLAGQSAIAPHTPFAWDEQPFTW